MERDAPYEMYNPMVAMEVAAAKATELPKLGRPRIKLRVHASQTNATILIHGCKKVPAKDVPVLIGDLRLISTLWKNLCPGIPPSRANAYIIRLLEVIENVPQKNMAPMTIVCEEELNVSDEWTTWKSRAYHEYAGAFHTHCVQEDLRDGLSGCRTYGGVQVLY